MAQRLLTGCLRNDGTGWAVYTNGTHFSENIASVTQDNEWIIVSAAGSPAGVQAILACPDETLAKAGIIPGGSGGGSITKIGLFKDGVRLNPADVNTTTYPWSNIWLLIVQEE